MSIKQLSAHDRLDAFKRATGGIERAAKRWAEAQRPALPMNSLPRPLPMRSAYSVARAVLVNFTPHISAPA